MADPISIASLISSGIGGIASLFGGNRLDPKTLAKYFGVNALGRDTQNLFSQFRGSPYGEFGMANAAFQGNQFGAELARRGSAIGGSGIGLIASSAASATQAASQGQFLADLFSQAQQGAAQNLQARLAAYAGGGDAPNPVSGLFSTIGAGLGQYAMLNQGRQPGPNTNTGPLALAGTGGTSVFPSLRPLVEKAK